MEHFDIKEYVSNLFDSVLDIVPIGHHHLKRHLVFLIETNTCKYVLKLYFKPNKWNREVSALKLLSESKWNTPNVVSYGVHNEIEYLVMEYIEGDIMGNTNGRLDIYQALGKQVANIHKYNSYSSFGVLNVDTSFKLNFASSKEYFQYEARRHLENIIEYKHPDWDTIDKGISLFFEMLENMTEVEYGYLTHNDISNRNILLRNEEFHTLIDFEQSCVQDRYRELAFVEYYLNRDNPKCFEMFLKGYEEVFDFDYHQFHENKDIYILHLGIAICSWSVEVDSEHYMEGIEIIKQYI